MALGVRASRRHIEIDESALIDLGNSECQTGSEYGGTTARTLVKTPLAIMVRWVNCLRQAARAVLRMLRINISCSSSEKAGLIIQALQPTMCP